MITVSSNDPESKTALPL